MLVLLERKQAVPVLVVGDAVLVQQTAVLVVAVAAAAAAVFVPRQQICRA